MSTPPICRIHGTAMAVSKFGGWYCTAQMEDETYCKEKVRAPKPSSIQGVQPATALLPKDNSDALLKASALNFAAQLCRGAGPAELGDDAIQLAIRAYQALKAIA